MRCKMKVRISESELTLGVYEVADLSQPSFDAIVNEECQEGVAGCLIPFDIVEFTEYDNSVDFVISDGDERYYFSAVRVD